MAIAVTLSSCLITQQTHFDEPPNSPPAIYDRSPSTSPISNIIRSVPTTSNDGGGGSVQLTLQVTVVDADIDQTLSWRVFVDNTLHMGSDLAPSSASTGRERRPLDVTVNTPQLLTTGCHRIDLFVSGGFSGIGHTSREANDLDAATWFVVGDSSAELLSCADLMTTP